MMDFQIRGENVEVTDALRDYVEKKVKKLERYFEIPPHSDVHVNMKVYNDEHGIEITIPMKHLLLRAEEKTADMYAAIDLVVEKLERQIRKHKTKVNRKFRQEGSLKQMFIEEAQEMRKEAVEEENDSDIDLVKTKRFTLKPMDAEEAVLQMDMLGHNFFVFSDAETNRTNVVYRRNDGKYGLIEPE